MERNPCLQWLAARVQVMSCPGGCIGGGGQPKTKGPDVLQRRMSAVYSIDSHMHLRKSHENPQVKVRGMYAFMDLLQSLWFL
jgi:iron only hydrogenase large subunit-like protein